jgi:hypothetical protein
MQKPNLKARRRHNLRENSLGLELKEEVARLIRRTNVISINGQQG